MEWRLCVDFLELSKKRYSVLEYQNKQVPDEMINKILEAGIAAPTACNFQPQKVKLIISDEDKERLNHVVPSKCLVPVAILVCYDKSVCWIRNYDGKSSGEIDAAIVTTHMMLEATELGLGSIWVMHWNPDVMRAEFNIPDQYEPVALLIVGYPKEGVEPHKGHYQRKVVDEILF